MPNLQLILEITRERAEQVNWRDPDQSDYDAIRKEYHARTGEAIEDAHVVVAALLASTLGKVRKAESSKTVGVQESFCDCGTCREAMAAAERLAQQTLEHQCPAWLVQICVSLSLICGPIVERIAKDAGVSSNELLKAMQDSAKKHHAFKVEIID